jgi:putative ABC transport system permease protein
VSSTPRLLGALLLRSAWPEWRRHPWRHAVALAAVALGVALAFSVHLINASALAEFSSATRAASGEPDVTLRAATRDGLDDVLFDRMAQSPGVEQASPVLEIDSLATASNGARVPLKLLGIDALSAVALAPALQPRPANAPESKATVLDPDAVFLNATARRRLGLHDGDTLRVQHGGRFVALRVAGSVAAADAPLAVMDIAGAQVHFERVGRLSRIDLRLRPGATLDSLPAGTHAVTPEDSGQRVSSFSRAYRVNLTVLALVALFVGAFLVFSVQALSVARRTPQLALLGVLGLTPRERLAMVLCEGAVIGALGSVLGLLLGSALAALALRLLAGDLGGGYFQDLAAPPLRFSWQAASLFGVLGFAAAVAGSWMPARQAQSLAPAAALKGLGDAGAREDAAWHGPALIAASVVLAMLPPIHGLPLAAYASVALLLMGGIACVPASVQALLVRLPRQRSALTLLAVQRARHQRHAATVAVAGVVASLSLAVALTVMVGSFRNGVAQWLDVVLPADLYARTATGSASSDDAWLPHEFAQAAARVPGVTRVEAQRVRPLQLAPDRPTVSLLVRPLGDLARRLPLLGTPLAPRSGETGVYVSEPLAGLYDVHPGAQLTLPLDPPLRVRVLGVWRDYARQAGAIAIDEAAYRAHSGDDRINDLALWLAPHADVAAVERALREQAGDPAFLEFAQTQELRRVSLAIFDRSFAVTYYLQALAIGIGLFGIAASVSAQVLARRKEFGLLTHLGFTRAQVVGVVAGEAAVWTTAGTVLGLLLGLAVSVILVDVVNPQSFHWSMDLHVPWPRLSALCAAVLAAGTLTAALSARAAAGRDAVLAVKEDW